MDFVKYLPRLFNTIVITEYITFVAAIILLSRKKVGIWQLFIPFLFINILVETTGWYQNWILKIKTNGLVFNFNMIMGICFYLWIISRAAIRQQSKKIAFSSILLFLIFATANLLIFQGFKTYNSSTEVFGDILIIFITCHFFYAIIKEDSYRNLFNYEYYWIANGLLFYSLGAFVLYIYYTYLQTLKTPKLGATLYILINNILNILLYGSLIIAFICRNRNTRLLQR